MKNLRPETPTNENVKNFSAKEERRLAPSFDLYKSISIYYKQCIKVSPQSTVGITLEIDIERVLYKYFDIKNGLIDAGNWNT